MVSMCLQWSCTGLFAVWTLLNSYCTQALSIDVSVTGPVLSLDFPDPSIIRIKNGTYFAFATNSNGTNARIAASSDWEHWTVIHKDALPLLHNVPSWIVKSTEKNVWAPDVIQLQNGSFAMTYSASANTSSGDTSKHCIGVAISESVTGPYTPVSDEPFVCDTSVGGAIDSSYFRDHDGTLYMLYKIDGNSIQKQTPIMIQQVHQDGYTTTGLDPAVQILVNEADDGGVTEAPFMVHLKTPDIYVLTFSTGDYASDAYTVSYALASSPNATFQRPESGAALLKTGDYGLGAPGGASLLYAGDSTVRMVFHANLGGPKHNGEPRAMWTGNITISGDGTLSA